MFAVEVVPELSAPEAEVACHAGPSPAQSEDLLLALTMWGEARGEGYDGMRAVGHVIRNRAISPRFPSDVTDVIFQPNQFAVWEGPISDPELTSGPDLRAWRVALPLADAILRGCDPDPTRGALYYHTQAVLPYWAEEASRKTVIGAHVFYVTLD